MKKRKETALRAIIESIPPTQRATVVNEIITRCNVGMWAFQSWCSGTRIPKPSSMMIISEILNVQTAELFPEHIAS